MKDRIEELAREAMKNSKLPESSIAKLFTQDAITTAVNETLELAAMECEKLMHESAGYSHNIAHSDDAAAIRKLKVE